MSNQDFSDVTFEHAMAIYNFHMDQISRARYDSTPFSLSFWGGVEMSIVPVEIEDRVNSVMVSDQQEITPEGIYKWKNYTPTTSVGWALDFYSRKCQKILKEIAKES